MQELPWLVNPESAPSQGGASFLYSYKLDRWSPSQCSGHVFTGDWEVNRGEGREAHSSWTLRPVKKHCLRSLCP